MIMLKYETARKLNFGKELGDLVAFFKRRGFTDEKFAECEVQGPYRKYGKSLGANLWQGHLDVKSPFHKKKLRYSSCFELLNISTAGS